MNSINQHYSMLKPCLTKRAACTPTLGILAYFQAFSYSSAFFQADGIPFPKSHLKYNQDK